MENRGFILLSRALYETMSVECRVGCFAWLLGCLWPIAIVKSTRTFRAKIVKSSSGLLKFPL